MFFSEMDRFVRADQAMTLYNAERALRERTRPLEREGFGEAVALCDLDGSSWYYNRVIGLRDPESLDDVCAWYEARGRAFSVTLLSGQLDGVGQALVRRGFEPSEEAVFVGRTLRGLSLEPARLEIRRARRQDLPVVYDLWGAQVSTELGARREQAHLDPRFAIYLAFLEGAPVAMATSFISEGMVWLGNANTRPDHRGRGCHNALITRRLLDARDAGCDWALLDTEYGSQSHKNASRYGMQVLFWWVQMGSPREG